MIIMIMLMKTRMMMIIIIRGVIPVKRVMKMMVMIIMMSTKDVSLGIKFAYIAIDQVSHVMRKGRPNLEKMTPAINYDGFSLEICKRL